MTGAMAKWGLLIYKEESLLVDPVSAPGSSKQEVAQIVGKFVKTKFACLHIQIGSLRLQGL